MIKTYLQESYMNSYSNCIIMISRFCPSKLIHPHTDDCCHVPMEREVMIASQAAKGTKTVCFIVHKNFVHKILPPIRGGLNCTLGLHV